MGQVKGASQWRDKRTGGSKGSEISRGKQTKDVAGNKNVYRPSKYLIIYRSR